MPVTEKVILQLKPKHAFDACGKSLDQFYGLVKWYWREDGYTRIVGEGRYRIIDLVFPFQVDFKVLKDGEVRLSLWADTSNPVPLQKLAEAILKYERDFHDSVQAKSAEEQQAIDRSAYDAVIFMSYARADYDFADKLRRDLLFCDLEVWVDQDYLHTGVTWPKEIECAIEKADAFVLVLSPEAVKSEWVPREIIHAQQNQKLILPVVHGKITLPPQFQELIGKIETGDLGKGKYPEGLLELVDVIKRKKQVDPEDQKIYEALRDSL
jgi:hypothetical protein